MKATLKELIAHLEAFSDGRNQELVKSIALLKANPKNASDENWIATYAFIIAIFIAPELIVDSRNKAFKKFLSSLKPRQLYLSEKILASLSAENNPENKITNPQRKR